MNRITRSKFRAHDLIVKYNVAVMMREHAHKEFQF